MGYPYDLGSYSRKVSAAATSSSSTAPPRWPSGFNWQPDAIRFAHFAVWFALV